MIAYSGKHYWISQYSSVERIGQLTGICDHYLHIFRFKSIAYGGTCFRDNFTYGIGSKPELKLMAHKGVTCILTYNNIIKVLYVYNDKP